ncbi:MAG: hypothetical protein Q7T45_21240 [Bradyrhizobium sp.]|uniref:hypothetical protein n=1 Tax=Bradyrhizobium sp. TaxID=376 RepID=UPI00272023A2|nr:hypothetical protein [Bradyrhizobium sp.]MDO8400348.1 hypothetical protein [Bradyrhizobium sp.]
MIKYLIVSAFVFSATTAHAFSLAETGKFKANSSSAKMRIHANDAQISADRIQASANQSDALKKASDDRSRSTKDAIKKTLDQKNELKKTGCVTC